MKLYDYQKKVAQHLRAGKSVILQAPTGSGKTFAALWPYLEAWDKNQPANFPRRCIYSVPMRVLANQFVEATRKVTTEEMLLVDLPKITIQTGEHAADPKFSGDLIFATIDQSLSSALAVPYSLSPGMANLNAGAFYASYLVFDEFHLFPVADEGGALGALTTTLQLLMEIKGIVPFVLMTATFSSTMLNELARLLDAEVVQVSAEEYATIAAGDTGQARSRQYFVCDSELTAQAVVRHHQTRSIAICNQVKRAQTLFSEIQEQVKGTNTKVMLLHSRFTPEDRAKKEVLIRKEFGKELPKREVASLILVATQVIEVGLDITCEHLHTEIAPANAIFQRAGRCARNPGEQGQVHIYNVPPRAARSGQAEQTPKPDFLPYPAALCTASWQSLWARNGQTLNFLAEQVVIDEVHTDADRQLLEAMQRQRKLLWDDIYAAMQDGAREQRARLIRRVDNITMLAATTPDAIGNPYKAQGFGLWRGTVKGIYHELQELAKGWTPAQDDQNWLLKFPMPTEPKSDDPTEPVVVQWRDVNDVTLLDSTALVLINSAFCAYDDELGFRIVPPAQGGWSAQPGELKQRNSQGGYSYRLESYTDHIGNMLKIYRQTYANDSAYVQKRIAQQWQMPDDVLQRGVQLAIALHDVGKLDKRWQRWARLYQAGISEALNDPDYMAVHTHWEPTDDKHKAAKKAADKQCQRPPHAGESAIAAAWLVAEQCGQDSLTRAVLTAIARHHSPRTSDFGEYELHPAAAPAIQAALGLAQRQPGQQTLRLKAPNAKLSQVMIESERFNELLLYFWIVRMLRLCDGLSQEE